MRVGLIFVVLTSMWLSASSASAMQLRLMDRPLMHPLAPALSAQVLGGSGGEVKSSRTPAFLAETITSVIINGGAIALTVKTGLSWARSEPGGWGQFGFLWVGVLGGITALSGLFSPMAVNIAAAAYDERPSFGKMLGLSMLVRMGIFLLMCTGVEFMNEQSSRVFLTSGTAVSIAVGGVLDVVLAQSLTPPTTAPAAQNRPPVALNDVGVRTFSVPMFSMRF